MQASLKQQRLLSSPDAKGRRPALETMLTLVARKVMNRRFAAGWTQEELARRAGVRAETISRLESGKHRPRRGTLARIDTALSKAV